jgi:Ca2+-dependent lipid-binding protein
MASSNSINIYVSCRNLVDLDVLGKSDPFVELFIKTEKETTWLSLGKSEVVWNDLNPDFIKVFLVNYFFEKNQILRAEIYEHDEEAPELIGSYETKLNKLLTCPK